MLTVSSQIDRSRVSGPGPEVQWPIVIRPMVSADRDLQRAFFNALSPSSRFNRFMGAMSEVPEGVLRALSKVDGTSHVAFAAESELHRGMIAEARLVRDAGDPMRAEFAVTVAEPWQGRGLAKTLMQRLETNAVDLGVNVLYGAALLDNRAMRNLASQLGYRVSRNSRDPRTVHLTKSLHGPDPFH